MILETLFSGVGTSVVDKLFDLARQKNEEKLRTMIQEELAKLALRPPSNPIIIVNIHIGDVVQQVLELSNRGISAQDVIDAVRAHTFPELLSPSVVVPGLAAASLGPDHVECFYRGADNHLRHRWYWHGSGWSEEHDLGGSLTSAPTAVSWGPDRIDCFYRGLDNHLKHRWWNGSSWGYEEDLGGILASAPSVSSLGPNHLDCFYRGQDNHLWHRWWDGSSGRWSEEHDLGGILTSAPAAISRNPHHIECFYRGQDDQIWHRWWNGYWGQEYFLGGKLT